MRHELHLLRVGVRAVVPVGLVAVGVAAAFAGGRGAASAAAAVGLVTANNVVAAFSTGWAPTISPNVVAIGYAVFVGRMLALLGAFAALASMTWIHSPSFAIAFCAALVVVLAAECVSYARRTYVPNWRAR